MAYFNIFIAFTLLGQANALPTARKLNARHKYIKLVIFGAALHYKLDECPDKTPFIILLYFKKIVLDEVWQEIGQVKSTVVRQRVLINNIHNHFAPRFRLF